MPPCKPRRFVTATPFLQDSIKHYRTDQEKLYAPQRTIANVLTAFRTLKPRFSVRLKRIDSSDRLHMPVYLCELTARSQQQYPETWCFKHRAHGKGVDPAYSKASALMEMIERFSCSAFLCNSSNFHRARSGTEKKRLCLDSVIRSFWPEFKHDAYLSSFLKKIPLRWVRAFSLTRNRYVLFPDFFVTLTSNGFAAGNSLEEAVLQGLCEVIERHCIRTVTSRNIATPSIDAASIQNDAAQKIILKFKQAGIDLYIKDFSCGFEIPTIGVLAHERKGKKAVRLYCAAGTSLNKNTALLRALNEVCQHRAQTLFYKKAAGVNTFAFPYYGSLKSAVCFTDSTRGVDFSALPTYSHTNYKQEIEQVVNGLRVRGLEAFAVDVTCPRLDIPTVIAAVPAASYFRPINPYELLTRYHWRAGKHREALQILDYFIKHHPGQYGKNKKYFLSLYARIRDELAVRYYWKAGKHREALQIRDYFVKHRPGRYGKNKKYFLSLYARIQKITRPAYA